MPKILFVENQADIPESFYCAMQEQYQLHIVNSAENGLTLLRSHEDFELIISNSNLCEFNNGEFLKQSRIISPYSIQILLMNADELNELIPILNQLDVYRYLIKPLVLEELVRVIGNALLQYNLLITKQELQKELEYKNTILAISLEAITQNKQLLEQQLAIAKTVYDKIDVFSHEEPDGLDYIIETTHAISSGFLLTHVSRDRQWFYLMMGDTVGQGFYSTLALTLVSEVFEGQCPHHPHIEELAHNINQKICHKLPDGMFCVGFLLKLHLSDGRMHVWQGGMPAAYFLDEQGKVLKKLSSENMPLGLHAEMDLAGTASFHDTSGVSSMFVCNQALLEQVSDAEGVFGSEMLEAVLSDTRTGIRRVDNLIGQLLILQQQFPQTDDICILELHFSRLTKALESI